MALFRWVWIAAGMLSLAVAVLGVVLPLVPTTPLVLLAAFCFSKGSPRLHQWLRQSKHFGPLLLDWENHGVIKTRSKIMATVAIVLLFGLSFYLTSIRFSLKIMLIIIAICILLFIWSRPSEIAEPTEQN